MELILEQAIKEKIKLLVDFILAKNPNASRDRIYHKIYQLNIVSTPLQCNPSKNIIESVVQQAQTIKVRKSLNSSNYILVGGSDHSFDDLNKNKFVMDIRSKTVVGVENFKGEVEPLNKCLIEVCHKYKLRYELPLNLNIGDELVDAVISDEIRELGLNYAESDSEESDEHVS